MRNIILIAILSVMTSCYSYKQAEAGFKNFEKNNNYKVIHNNTEKEIKVLSIEKDSIKIKYFNYKSDMQTKINVEKISINEIESVKTQKLSLLKTSGLMIASMATAGFLHYACCFDLNWK